MTVKQHTPSGAQRSTSARTTNRPATPGRPKNTAAPDKKNSTKGKADAQRADDELTPERIRAILESPDVTERVKDTITAHVGRLYEAVGADTLPECADTTLLEFEEAQSVYLYYEEKGEGREKAREAYARLAAAVERHEPKAFKLARRVAAIYAEAKERGDREDYIMQAADEVLISGGEGVMLQSPASEFFVAFFVKATRDLAPSHYAYAQLRRIVSQYGAGSTLREMVEKEEAQGREANARRKAAELAKPEPKDKTSDEWRYWKLRRMEQALRSGDAETFRAARLEAARLIGEAIARFEPGHVETIISILPALIIDRQQSGEVEVNEPEPPANLPTTIPRGRFNRKGIAQTLAAARQEGTEDDYEAQLLGYVLGFKRLDRQTHVNTVGFLATLYLKIQEMPATARQALFSDPTFAQALYPHVKLAFPEQVKEAFKIYFGDLAERVPHILDQIQKRADKEGASA